MSNILLNKEQKKAVSHGSGPLLIVAGAGTGKTTVVTERIKHLILDKKYSSDSILALTFTEKAAYEMQERVDIALPLGYTQLWISTFHAFCDRILRNEAIHIGLNPGYRLLTQSESVQLFRDNLFDFDLEYFRPLSNPTKFVLGLLTHFSRLRDEDIGPGQYSAWIKKQKKISKEDKEEQEKWAELARVYKQYEELKVTEGVMDFADLIAHTLDLFRKRAHILKTYQSQFQHILVDEFQDTNIAQYELIKLIAPPKNKPNLCVVGDDSQSIYKFRGAAVSNILSFMKEYKSAKQIVLNNNYRSTQEILDSAHKLIKHNDPDTLEARLGISKKLKSITPSNQESIDFIYTAKAEQEADEVVKIIEHERAKNNIEYKDVAILVRANNHADPFIHALKRSGIPYQFLGPGMLFKQSEVLDLIAYLKVLDNFSDSVSFYRVLNMDIWSLSARDVGAISNYAKRHNTTLFEAAERMTQTQENTTQESFSFVAESSDETLEKIIAMIYRHMELKNSQSAGQILYYFLQDSGLLEGMASYDTVKQEQEVQNISKLFDKLKSYELDHEDASVAAVVSWIDLAMELGESPLAGDTDWTDNNAVNILTIHSSKGLEFPVVFLPNLVSGRFPTYNRREQIPIPEDLIKESLPEGDFHAQEERRLFYVGMTRAKKRLVFTASKLYGEGKRARKLSPFIPEALGEEVIQNAQSQQQTRENQLTFLDYAGGSDNGLDSKKASTHKVSYLSYSQIETFKFCPMHYKARYILKLPVFAYAAATYGQVMHQTMNQFYQQVLDGAKPTEKRITSIYDSLWDSRGYKDKKQELLMKQLGINQLITYLDTQFDRDTLPKLLEKQFIFSVKKDLKFGGVVDRVDLLPNGKIEIIDYKTSNKIPTQRDVDKNLQLTLYALAAMEVKEIGFGKEPEDILLSLYFFKENVKLTTTRTREQLTQAQQEVIQIAQDIETSDFVCSGTKWCNNCEYKMLCEIGS